jgi:integrase
MAQTKKRTTKSGETRYDVRTRIGDRVVTKTFKRRRDADNYATTIEHERMSGFAVDPSGGRMSVSELMELWIKSNPGKRGNTVGRDQSDINAHICPAIGERRINTIRQSDVQYLVNEWSKVLSPRSVARTYGTLRAAFAYAVSSERIGRTPCRDVKLPQPRRTVHREVGPDEVAALALACDARHQGMVWTAALLGLRWGEVAALRLKNLDLLNATISITESVTRDKHGRTTVGAPKSEAGVRSFSMPRALCDILAAHLARMGLTAVDSDALVFPSPGGGAWSYSNYRRRVWLPAVASVGLQGIGFHDLRRSNATALVISGVDPKTTQTRLGHSDPRLTLALYAQATTAADRGAAETLGEQFAAAMNRANLSA